LFVFDRASVLHETHVCRLLYIYTWNNKTRMEEWALCFLGPKAMLKWQKTNGGMSIISLFFNKSRWNRIRILLFCLLYRYVMVKSAIFFIIFLKARNSSHAHFNFQIKVLFKTS
jgi:hypothetical protein